MSASHHAHRLALVIPVLTVFSGWAVVIGSSDRTVAPDVEKARWVRTADGWERAHWLIERRSPSKPPLHPVLVAIGLCAASASVLVWGYARTKQIEKAGLPAILISCDDRL